MSEKKKEKKTILETINNFMDKYDEISGNSKAYAKLQKKYESLLEENRKLKQMLNDINIKLVNTEKALLVCETRLEMSAK